MSTINTAKAVLNFPVSQPSSLINTLGANPDATAWANLFGSSKRNVTAYLVKNADDTFSMVYSDANTGEIIITFNQASPSGKNPYGVATGGNAYKVVLNTTVTLEIGQTIDVKINQDNTGASTLSIDDGVTTKPITGVNAAAIPANTLLTDTTYSFSYSGTSWALIGAVQQQTPTPYNEATGVANAYLVTLTGYTLVDGHQFSMKIPTAQSNTGASTVAINGGGAQNIFDTDGNAIPTNTLVGDSIYDFVYNSDFGGGVELLGLSKPIVVTPLATPILKAALATLKDDIALVPGMLYAITDWSAIERVYVIAQNAGILDNHVVSNNFPTDVININFTDADSDNWFISYREDTIKNLSAYYDWRTVKFKRWETVTGNGIWTSLVSTGGAFMEFYTFGNTIDVSVPNFIPAVDGNGSDNQNISLGSSLTPNVFNSIFGLTCIEITAGNNFINNTISNFCQTNIIGDNFQNNIIGNNMATNTIAENVLQNKIGNGFSANNIKNNFINNIIGNVFVSNDIGVSFGSNIVGDSFKLVTTLAPVQSLNFSAATYVSQNGSKIINASNDISSTLFLSYLDNVTVPSSPVVVYKDPIT